MKTTITKSFAVLLLTALCSLLTVRASADTVPVGIQVTLTATADGTQPFTYQWQKAGVNIPGATASTFVIASFSASDAATYSVTIANSAGSISTTAVLAQQVLPPSNPKISIVQKLLAWLKSVFKIFA